jgi:hypothetical protein
MRRPLLFMAVLLGAGVWFSEHFSGEYAAYAGMAFGAAAVALSRRFPVLAAGAAAVAVFVFGWTRGSLARRIPEDSIHRVSVGYATMYGTVIRPFQKNKFHRTGWVELDTMEAGGKRFSVSGRMVVKIAAPGADSFFGAIQKRGFGRRARGLFALFATKPDYAPGDDAKIRCGVASGV